MNTPLLDNCCFIHTLPVNWGDMDAFGHVNNTQYFRYFEHARTAHFSATGIWGLKDRANLGAIVAEAHCRFKAPLTFPDTLHIGVQIADLQETQFIQRYRIYSEKLDCIAAEGEVRVVFYDYTNNCRSAIPQSIFQTLQQQAQIS